MSNTVRNILAVVAGAVASLVINGFISFISPMVIPPPAGVDISTVEGLEKGIHLFGPVNFVMPFLAHALASFGAGFIGAKLAASYKMPIAIGLGAFTMLGGIAAVILLPAPIWFEVFDLVFAYIPMAYLGGMLAGNSKGEE